MPAASPTSRSQREVLDALADVISVDTSASTGSASRSPVEAARRGGTAFENSSASFSGRAPMAAIDAQPSVPTKDAFDPVGPTSRYRGTPQSSTAKPMNGKDVPAPPPPSKGAFGRFANAFRRHNTEDKDRRMREKERRMQERVRNEPSRMDIIDRMDLSGLGTSLFHHDSPYDACSPHSNRNLRRAPVKAFDETIDPMTGQPIGAGRAGASGSSSNGRHGLSPLAAATMRKMSDNVGDVPGEGIGNEALLSNAKADTNARNRSKSSAQVPVLGRNGTTSTLATSSTAPTDNELDETTSHNSLGSTADRDVDAEHAYRNNRGYFTQVTSASRDRADVANPNADIWGVSSEPWQDFAQPANRLDVPSRTSGDGLSSAASSVFDMEAVMTGRPAESRTKSSLGKGSGSSGGLGVISEGNGPKRSKSLMKRIKQARQYGNVPPPDEDVVDRAEAVAAANSNGPQQRRINHHHSPSTPPLQQSVSPHFDGVAHDSSSLGRSGTLKANSYENGGAQAHTSGMTTAHSNGSASGLGRSGSLFGRMRGSGKSRERNAATGVAR